MSKRESFTKRLPLSVNRISLSTVVIHFAGDSGDGMQLAGMQFTQACVEVGNDVKTFPDFPAEIRAPTGTLAGVSGFQLSFSDKPIYTPGDRYDVLVAMNPAALKAALKRLRLGGVLIIDEDKFTEKELKKSGYLEDPLLSLVTSYRLIRLPMTSLTLAALTSLSRTSARKCKNIFALGVLYWLYHRPLAPTQAWIESRFKHQPDLLLANQTALRVGYDYAITTELFAEHYTVEAATLPPGEYCQVTGNQALAWGCVAAAVRSKQPLLVCGYPITPASDILQLLTKYPHFGISTFQAEDEIAAIGAAIGAAFGGVLALTSTSGPGMDLKSESLGLAVMVELPLVVIDVQRAGPSTGIPTKGEQSDLLMALFGRHGECPLPVLAPSTPGDCFHMLLEAFRIAIHYMTPVILLSDAFLANSAESWQIPDTATLPDLVPIYHKNTEAFLPYQRDAVLSRPWVIPGTAGLMHRIGGLEKEHETGNISYDPDNHEKMVALRSAKIQGIEKKLPALAILGKPSGEVLVIGWGSTYGVIRTVVEAYQAENKAISAVHLRYLYPLQSSLAAIIKNFKEVIVVELNSGQLCQLLRARFLIDAKGINKIAGRPMSVDELKEKLLPYVSDLSDPQEKMHVLYE